MLCLNCNKESSDEGIYCPYCAQKRTTGHIQVKDIVSDFFVNFFNIDSKFFRSIGNLFIPGKLTKQFFAGKHKSFYAPMRLFLVSMISFFAIISFFFLSNLNFSKDIYKEFFRTYIDNEMLSMLDSAKVDLLTIDSSKQVRNTIDTFKQKFIDRYHPKNDNFIPIFQLSDDQIKIEQGKIELSPKELFELSLDEIYVKYKITKFWNKLLAKQSIRVVTDLGGLIKFVISNITWMLIILVPILAGIMKLLYIRSKHLYVEHLVFLFHFHSFLFLALSLVVVSIKYLPWWCILFFSLLPLFYLYKALRKYYNQSRIKTTLKLSLLIFAYAIFINVTLVLTLLVSFAIF